jgi:Fe-S oxidoreductase
VDYLSPFKEGIDLVRESGAEGYSLCWQCGLCSAVCPWNMVRSFLPHRLICGSRYGLIDLEDEEWWRCSTCDLCMSRCPRGVGITDIIRAARRIMLEFQYERAPASLRSAMASLGGQGNPWGSQRGDRAAWAKDLGVQTYSSKEHDLLYFPCCVPACDPKLASIARATATLLKKAGASFGILGEREGCCGESVRKAGHETLFDSLMRGNSTLFREEKVKEIVLTSPHCLTTFRQDYPGLSGSTRILHMTQFLAGAVETGRLSLNKTLQKRIVYHDPCYLGRHNGIYDEPRTVLGSIPGVTLVDEVESRGNTLCCGGGGGRIWMETPKGERFSDLLVEQALDMGADMLVTACPYCLLNFKDSVATSERAGSLEVRDITEVVVEALEG